MLIDTHTHLNDPEFDGDRPEVIQRALDAGVKKMVLVGTDLPSSERAVALAEQYPFLFATVGVHPHESKGWNEPLSDAIERLARTPKVVGIGECGLDFYYNHSPRESQRHAFVEQIRLAKRCALPLVVHTRDAWAETFELLEKEKVKDHAADIGAVFHCFTGNKEIVQQALRFGFYISFSGIMTFPKALSLQESAALTDLTKILIETDAPYLAPQGFRGKRNEPAYVRAVAEKLAELHFLSLEEISNITSRNAIRLFKLPTD